MLNLGGRITGLSSAANTLADVDLRGNLENQSPLRITGRINPLRDDLFVDLKVSFTDIELSPLTPYSGTFLGYTVDKGKLFLDLKYHIENKKLESENKVFIDQFTFGNKVESDKATSLPVRLAVALLKDRKGEIHLDLPVTGRTDDPKFSIWGLVLQVLKNLLVKAATSPFALLQSVFGGKEDFSSVSFASGSARLSDAERGKLVKLAQMLTDRPALKLEVTGFVDKEHDPEGYRNELLLKKMKNEKFLALVKEKKALEGQSADNLEILPPEYSKLLKGVYRKEKFPKPRNFIGLVKDLPDEEMKKLILTHTVVGNEDLQNLARDRGVAVRNFLIADGKLPAERIFEKKGDIFKATAREGESASRVEFGMAVQ
jgi:outer membrane protein OmpA-like peptidoglycan-associated protein